jgi:hypothetical protein
LRHIERPGWAAPTQAGFLENRCIRVLSRYRVLFSVPGFSRLLVSSVFGRLPSGMFSLAILLFVRERTDSFLVAGLAVGAFTLAGAVMAPVQGGIVDRLG